MGINCHFKILKMKLFYFFGAALGLELKDCHQNLYDSATNPELYASLTTEIIQQNIATFGTCLHSQGIDASALYRGSESVRGPPMDGTCINAFADALIECGKIANGHPFCVEDHPNYNVIACTIKLNQCLLEELSDIFDYCNV